MSNNNPYDGKPYQAGPQNYNANQAPNYGDNSNYNNNNVNSNTEQPYNAAPNYNQSQSYQAGEQNYANTQSYDYNNNTVNGCIPRPKVSFIEAIKGMFKNYAVFTGRASKSEYWWNVLFVLAVSFSLAIINMIVLGVNGSTVSTSDGNIFEISSILINGVFGLFILAVVVPFTALTVRRLHDADLSGLLYFVIFIPFIGHFILLFLVLKPSKVEGQRFDKSAQPWVPERAQLPNVNYIKEFYSFQELHSF